jgi:hypothetical protein
MQAEFESGSLSKFKRVDLEKAVQTRNSHEGCIKGAGEP